MNLPDTQDIADVIMVCIVGATLGIAALVAFAIAFAASIGALTW